MRAHDKLRVVALAGVLLADGVFNAIPNEWVKNDLDHLEFPERLRFVLPILKVSSSTGLLLGLRFPRVGRLTSTLLIPYFIFAIGFHARARDSVARTAPAAVMLAWSGLAVRAYPSA